MAGRCYRRYIFEDTMTKERISAASASCDDSVTVAAAVLLSVSYGNDNISRPNRLKMNRQSSVRNASKAFYMTDEELELGDRENGQFVR